MSLLGVFVPYGVFVAGIACEMESSTKSHPVCKAKIRFLVYSGSFKNAPDQISVAATKTLGANLFVPELTLFSMLLQSMECVKT